MPSTHAHQTFKRFEPKIHGNKYCQKITYINGALRMCEEPTKGRTYCEACTMRLITLTDRVPPTATVEEKHSWRKPMKL